MKAHKDKTLSATADTVEAVAKSDIIIVIVPVLVDEQDNTDYQYMDLAIEDIAKGIKKDSLVIIETTLPPGDTEHRFGKKIEEVSGLNQEKISILPIVQKGLFQPDYPQFKNYPKVVGGINKEVSSWQVIFINRHLAVI